MQDLAQDFGAYLRDELGRGSSTLERYLNIVAEFTAYLQAPERSQVGLLAVGKPHIVEFLRQAACTEEGPLRSAWNLRLAALRAFYDYLFQAELISVNPALRVRRLKNIAPEPIPLPWDEYLALVDAMETASDHYRSRNVAIVQVLFHTLLRVSELTSLNVAQIDFENHRFTNVRTKGDKWLSLPFSDLVAAAIERYLGDRQSFGPKVNEQALFLSDRGKRLSVRAVREILYTYGEKAGISRLVHPHLLRHSGATELAELGTPLPDIQRLLGHTRQRTTERYVHRYRDTARRLAVEALGREELRRMSERRAREPTPTPDRPRQSSA